MSQRVAPQALPDGDMRVHPDRYAQIQLFSGS
jgi:hypothetical protein